MSFDFTQINEENCPARWVRIADYLTTSDPDQLAALDENYKDTLEYVQESDFYTSRPAVVNVTVASKDTSEIVFNISSYDDDTPITYDMSKAAITAYPNANSAPTGAGTDITLSSGQWTDNAGFSAGDHIKYAFAATDSDAVEGAVVNIEVILAPSAIADVAAVDGTDGTATITFTEATGAASHTLYYMEDETDAATIIAGGTAVSSPTAAGEVVNTGAGDFGFAVVATNPGGSTNSNADTVTVTVI